VFRFALVLNGVLVCFIRFDLCFGFEWCFVFVFCFGFVLLCFVLNCVLVFVFWFVLFRFDLCFVSV
jgi:hypothetical protein